MKAITFFPFLCLSFTPFVYAQTVNFHELAKRCVPDVSSHTLAAIVKTESGFNPYAIGVNRGAKLSRQPKSHQEAVSTAKSLIAKGANIDMGIAQINSANLGVVKMSIEQLFDPCQNLKASALILSRNYQGAKKIHGDGQKALQAALSAYNTGSFSRGFNNGYVRKVLASAGSNTEQVTLKVPKLDPSFSTKAVPVKAKAQPTNIGGNKPRKSLIVSTVESNREEPIEGSKPHQSWDVFAEF
ncbi:lytic transglycosylase domain-containing protein [Neisseria sp. Ec49-e6-T10]|uniref:lytic transglycosylase domain-containing protein n=1 Tax=Neisseria sp. Ec49-e6-T10 TaxID=3140744 RepID=UPI003EB8FE53